MGPVVGLVSTLLLLKGLEEEVKIKNPEGKSCVLSLSRVIFTRGIASLSQSRREGALAFLFSLALASC